LVKDAGQYSGKDGSGLKLTVAKYLTPAQHDIARDGGLMPDVRCDDHPRGELASDACMEQAAAYVTSHARQRESAAPPPPNASARDV
jgi:C-terminal processing protease CtpA/Prc